MEDLKKSLYIRGGNVVGALGDKYFSTAPIGTVLSFAGQTAPHGYLLADGASYKVADYPHLYAVIGNTYGGDTESFNVPDYRETVLVGVGENTTDTIAAHDVYELGEFKDDQAQEHTHTLTIPNRVYQYTPTAAGGAGATGGLVATTSNNSGRKGTTTHGKQKGVTYIIKAFHTNEGVDSNDVTDQIIEYVEGEIAKVESKVDALISDTATSENSTWSSSKIASEIGRTQIPSVGTSTGWKAEKDLSSLPIGTYRLTSMHSSSGSVIDALILKTGYSYFLKTILKEGSDITVGISGDTLTVAESTTAIGVISVFLNTVGINA